MEEANTALEALGFNMGTRIVDEFMARSGAGRCHSFEETAEVRKEKRGKGKKELNPGQVLARTGFKMFLGTAATVVASSWSADRSSFALALDENPLTAFVELPEEQRKLKYSNVLCGVVRGALEMLQMRVECELVRDAAWGDDTTEIRVTLKEMMQEEVPQGDD